MKVEDIVREKAKASGLEKIGRHYRNVSYAFSNTKCHFIQSELEKGHQVQALVIPGLVGIFQKEVKTFEAFAIGLCDKVKQVNGGRGFVSTDELPGYGISLKEVKKLKEMVSADAKDLVVLVAAPSNVARGALDLIASYVEVLIHL